MISISLLLELKQILEEDYNLRLNLQETTEVGMNLVAFTETLLKIETKCGYEAKTSLNKTTAVLANHYKQELSNRIKRGIAKTNKRKSLTTTYEQK